jgi:hypothetical protein
LTEEKFALKEKAEKWERTCKRLTEEKLALEGKSDDCNEAVYTSISLCLLADLLLTGTPNRSSDSEFQLLCWVVWATPVLLLYREVKGQHKQEQREWKRPEASEHVFGYGLTPTSLSSIGSSVWITSKYTGEL